MLRARRYQRAKSSTSESRDPFGVQRPHIAVYDVLPEYRNAAAAATMSAWMLQRRAKHSDFRRRSSSSST
jgi:hypothetical protein